MNIQRMRQVLSMVTLGLLLSCTSYSKESFKEWVLNKENGLIISDTVSPERITTATYFPPEHNFVKENLDTTSHATEWTTFLIELDRMRLPDNVKTKLDESIIFGRDVNAKLLLNGATYDQFRFEYVPSPLQDKYTFFITYSGLNFHLREAKSDVVLKLKVPNFGEAKFTFLKKNLNQIPHIKLS